MRRLFGDAEHLVRVAGLFAAGVLAFLVLRGLLVPDDFGVYGHFRAGALADNRARALGHAGRGACVECHSDVGETLAGGKHARVGCEACHGPLARHAEDAAAQEAVKPDPRAVCLRCHLANVAKPEGFPQVEPAEHAPEGACSECHTPHSPGFE